MQLGVVICTIRWSWTGDVQKSGQASGIGIAGVFQWMYLYHISHKTSISPLLPAESHLPSDFLFLLYLALKRSAHCIAPELRPNSRVAAPHQLLDKLYEYHLHNNSQDNAAIDTYLCSAFTTCPGHLQLLRAFSTLSAALMGERSF